MKKIIILDGENAVRLALEVTPEEYALIERLCDEEVILSEYFSVVDVDEGFKFERP